MQFDEDEFDKKSSDEEDDEGLLMNTNMLPGEVYSCGYNYYGQLGNEHAQGTWYNSIPRVIPDLKNIIKIATGDSHSLALSENGEVFSWGCNRYGQLGLGDFAHCRQPQRIEAMKGEDVFDISCGMYHSAILTEAGEVFTFGCGSFGRLGHGEHKHLATPRLVVSLRGKRIVQVACGGAFTLAVSMEGSVFSWGCNRYGQVGHGKNSVQMTPRHLSLLHGKVVVKVACGRNHSLFYTNSNECFSLGAGAAGQLGNGVKKNQFTPSQVETFSPSRKLIGISGGYSHTVALGSDSTIYSWGYLSEDHLGLPETGEEYHSIPIIVSRSNTHSKVVQVDAGGWHSACVTDRGELYTWGFAYRGRLGLSEEPKDDKFPMNPQLVDALTDKAVLSVACGGAHTLVLVTSKEDYNVWKSQKNM